MVKGKISSEQIGKEKFIACIDFGVKKNIRFLELIGLPILVFQRLYI